MFEPYYDLLPPHWRYDESTDVFINDITQEESSEHPITIFMNARKTILNMTQDDHVSIEIEKVMHERYTAPQNANVVNDDGADEEATPTGESAPNEDQTYEQTAGSESFIPLSDENGNVLTGDQTGDVMSELNLPTGKFFEYHCQWSERDLFGKVNLYGLTLRFYAEQQRTLIKFDGLVGEWVYSAIKGPYGPMEQMDFFIGAKVNVFGRHLTISSASGSAIRWIEKERKRLEKQQERFREKITAVGQVPCIKGKDTSIVRHITRGADILPGHTDLRKLLLCNARLGAQLAALGLSEQL